MKKKLLLLTLFILPICTYAQIEVVNESMICDTNSLVLDIGKFNYLRFKNLPDSAVIMVSSGKIKPVLEDKSRYFIPGQTDMEGRITKLTITKDDKLIFSKQYRFRKIERYIDPIDSIYSGLPFRLGTRKLGNGGSLIFCRKEILDDPAFYSLIDGITIESFDITYLRKRQDPIGPINVIGTKIPKEGIEQILHRCGQIFIENIRAIYSDGSCMNISPLIITIGEEFYGYSKCDKAKVK